MSKVAIFAGFNFIATMGVVGYVVFSGSSVDSTQASVSAPSYQESEVREVRGEDGTTRWVRTPKSRPMSFEMEGPKVSAPATSGVVLRKGFDGAPASKTSSQPGRELADAKPDKSPKVVSVSSEEVVVAEPDHVVVPKPSYVKLYVGGMGDTINGFVGDNSYEIEIAAEDGVPDVSFQSYPYEGNSFRLTDYPGFCGRVAVAKHDKETVMWVPEHIDPDDGVLAKVAPLVSDPVKAKISSPDVPDLKVGVWVVCGKREDRIPPFYDMRILEQIDGVDLGNPTYIFES